MPKHQSAHTARDAQIFCPLSTHSAPSSLSTPVERMAARSEPALGSLQACAHTISLDAIVGRNRDFCSSVPTSMIVGPRRKMPFWFTRPGAPAR